MSKAVVELKSLQISVCQLFFRNGQEVLVSLNIDVLVIGYCAKLYRIQVLLLRPLEQDTAHASMKGELCELDKLVSFHFELSSV